MKKSKEIPIGGIGIINGYRVMAKEYLLINTCDDCCFSYRSGYPGNCPVKKCSAPYREDKKDVYFVIAKEVKDDKRQLQAGIGDRKRIISTPASAKGN